MDDFMNTAWDRPAANDRGPGIACAVSGIATPPALLLMLGRLAPALAERIEQDFPDLAPTALISTEEVDRYRRLLVDELLLAEHAELSALDQRVSLANRIAGGTGVIDPRPFALLQRVLADVAALHAAVVTARPAAPGLRDKIDRLIATQLQRMIEIQRLQVECIGQSTPASESALRYLDL